MSSEKRRREHLLVLRVTTEERETIRAAAAADGMWTSGYLRECALMRAESALSSTETAQIGSGVHRTADGQETAP